MKSVFIGLALLSSVFLTEEIQLKKDNYTCSDPSRPWVMTWNLTWLASTCYTTEEQCKRIGAMAVIGFNDIFNRYGHKEVTFSCTKKE